MNLIMIAIGGAAGSVARYLCVGFASRLLGAGFPYGTFFVNVLGSFLMGVAFWIMVSKLDGGASRWAPLIMTGFLGGFTTFSAFSLDGYLLVEEGRLGAAAAYAISSVSLALLGLLLGLIVARAWL